MTSHITDRIKQFINYGGLTDRVFQASVALTLIKLVLIAGQKLVILPSPHDDEWFLHRASDLLNFKWLGSYNNMTLIKGMFYPLWIAITHTAGIPLLISQHILYIFACAITVTALRPWLQSSKIRLFLYAVLLFNPMIYAVPFTTRVMRDSIYTSLTLLIVACSAAILLRLDRPLSNISRWLTALGLSLSAFWLTREEGLWITPLFFIILGAAMVFLWKRKLLEWSRIGAIGILPFIIPILFIGAVDSMNKLRYGIFSTVELKNSDFLDAYGALSRVKPAYWKPKYPVQKDVRGKIYSASPAFRELKPFLDGQVGAGWTHNSCITAGLCDDIGGGWFVWALRDSVALAGHYTSGSAAMGYYRRLASEINTACERHQLDCIPPRSTMMPVWHNEYNKPFLDAVCQAVSYLSGFTGFSVQSVPSEETPLPLSDLFSTMTHEVISPPPTGSLNISGWAFSPSSSPLSFYILKENGEKADATVERESSPDVYKHFLTQGLDIQAARKARFHITTSCYHGCSLLIEPGRGIPAKISLDGTVKGLETASLSFYFDKLNVAPTIKHHSTAVDKAKIFILDKIGRLYQTVMPALTVLSLAGYCIWTIFVLIRRLTTERWIIATSLIAAIVSRIILLSIIHVTSFPAIDPLYLEPAYPLLLLFQFLVAAECIVLFRARFISASGPVM